MRLGIDASNIRRGGGITHLRELLDHAEPPESGIYEVIVWAGRATLDQLPNKEWLVKSHQSELDKGFFQWMLWKQMKLPGLLKNCDVLFVPGGSYTGSFKPYVAMSQNLLPFDLKESGRFRFSITGLRYKLLRFSQVRTFRNADGVIFLTRTALDTVQSVTGDLPGITNIVPHGISGTFDCAPKKPKSIDLYSNEKPFRWLYVSIVNLYKHQWNVVEAIKILRGKGFPVVIDLVGPAYPKALTLLNNAIRKHDPDRKFARYHGAIDYRALPGFYRNADAFVFASSCENLPIILLEAMRSGLPIISSNRGPMPEVLEGNGLYFDPESPMSIAKAMQDLILDPASSESLCRASHARALEYTWDKCARQTFDFIGRAKSMHDLKRYL